MKRPDQKYSPILPLHLNCGRVETPIGIMLILTGHDRSIRAIDWTDHEDRMMRLLRIHYGTKGFKVSTGTIPRDIASALSNYFAGDVAAIDTLPVATAGTSFQRSVWRALRDIPGGETLTYAQIAAHIGKPAAVRATGHANGSNPVGVVVPCHRVIGANGSLTGYGGGMERKRWLLDHESKAMAAIRQKQPPIATATAQISKE